MRICDEFRHDCGASAVDFLAVSNSEDEQYQAGVLNPANEPVIAHAIFPEFPKAASLQSLPNATRIFQLGYSFV